MGLLKLEDGRIGNSVVKVTSIESRFLPASHKGMYSFDTLTRIGKHTEIKPEDHEDITNYLLIKEKARNSCRRSIVKVDFIEDNFVIVSSIEDTEMYYCPIVVKDILESGATGTYMFGSFDEALIGALVFKHQGYNSRLENYIPKMLFEKEK